MAETIFRGPGVVAGSLMDTRIEGFDGPSIGYQGDVIANPLYSPMAKDGLSPGRVKGWYNAFYSVSMDAIPSATSTTAIAASQQISTTLGSLLTLVTACAGTAAGVPVFAPGIPIIPLGTGSVVTVAVIDYGFATGTTTNNSSTVVVQDNRQFTLGQWLIIPGAGGTTNIPLITQVAGFGTASPANVTTLILAAVAQTTANNAPIGQGNLYSPFIPGGTPFGPANPAPNAWEPYRLAGLAAAFDPWQASCRNVTVTSNSVTSGTTVVLVTGYDIYGQLMAERIAATTTPGGAGKKAFKSILNVAIAVTATTGSAAPLTVGIGDEVGMNLRSDRWEYSDIFYGGGFVVSTQGWTAATTVVATNTTGDVRGVVNASTVLTISTTSGSTIQVGSLNGANRMTIFQNVPLLNAISATPLNFTSVLGVAQATA